MPTGQNVKIINAKKDITSNGKKTPTGTKGQREKNTDEEKTANSQLERTLTGI
jgi:hypothetical protein